jgi:hypothetical protein
MAKTKSYEVEMSHVAVPELKKQCGEPVAVRS